MAPKLAKKPSRLVLSLKWGGCFAALVFGLGGLLMDMAPSSGTYETLSRLVWMIVAICMAAGFTGAVLDQAHKLPDS